MWRPRRGPAVASGEKKLTDMNAQTSAWTTSTLEVVSWKSQDGAAIEGVLHKPADFDPSRKYPLLVVIHGGPTGVSRAVPFTSAIYPIDVWVPRGILVLEPNYRGSAGYGEKFRSLNVRNLGVGDAWDVLSGVDSLVAKGLGRPGARRHDGLEPGRLHLGVPCHARRRALQGDFGRRRHLRLDDLLRQHRHSPFHAPVPESHAVGRSGDLREDVADHVHQAGEDADAHPARRHRPARAASERVRALSGPAGQPVPTKLIVYQGFGGIGHGPTKPKSHRATMEHNLEWFDQYMFAASAKGRVRIDETHQRVFEPALQRLQRLLESAAGAALGDRFSQPAQSVP